MAKKSAVKTTRKKAKSASGNTRQPKSSKGRNAASSKEQPAVLSKSEKVTPLTHEQIAERAEAIWQASGCLPGRDERNWCEAEAQLKAELAIA
jgi:hypothetical protein